ncbi:unnamed protein product [Rotaria sp. Silwood2]|nr:unnamed protein product [Rotaria sp. Silwood2]
MLLIGTDSLRYLDEVQVTQLVAYTIDYLHQNYPHLNKKQHISIVATFPCCKPSSTFPSLLSLSSNIQLYNDELNALSTNLNCTFVDFHVIDTQLAADQMHLHFNHRHLIPNSIITYFSELSKNQPPHPRIHPRSCDALKRHQKIRHNKLKRKQQQFYIKRNIDINWKYKHIK